MRRALAVRESVLVGTGAAALAVIVGMATAHGLAAPTGALLVTTVALVVGILDWERSIYGLLFYLPVSGLVTLAMYPNTAPGSVAKDVLFVIPAYIGFAVQWLRNRRHLAVPGLPVAALGALGALVLVETLNPAVPNALVAAIGVKTWLLYLPLAFLGYELVRDRGRLEKVLSVLAWGAVIPCVVGIVEAILVYTGHSGTVYSWYGAAATNATQGFAQIDVGTAVLHRIPSTFTSTTQFYSFTAAMAAIAYATWRGVLTHRGRGTVGLALLALCLGAATLSGARSAILLVPALVIVAVLLDTKAIGAVRGLLTSAVGLGLMLAITGVVLGSALRPLVFGVAQHGLEQLRLLFVTGLGHAFHTTTLGLGTGVDTIASRYALPAGQLFQVVGGTWQESWWVKAVLELGIAGLIVVVWLMSTLVIRGVRITRALSDTRLRPIAAAITALLIWWVITAFKAQNIDLDPINVYFWLLVGILLRLPDLADRASA